MIFPNFTPLHERRLAGVSHASEAKPLLLLHGAARRWQTFLPLWSSLSSRWQLHAFDFRGHGQSDRCPGAYRVCDYVQDAVAYIETHIDPGQSVVVYGHSLGAMVATALAAECGSRVAGMILEDPPLQTMGRRIRQTSLFRFFEIMHTLAGDKRPLHDVVSDLAEIRLPASDGRTELRLGDLRDEVSLRFTASCLQQVDADVFTPILATDWLLRYDTLSVLQNVKCPTLVLQADTSVGGMLTDEDADTFKQHIRDMTRVRFDRCGHLLHWEQTTELLNYLHGFLETLVD